MLSCPKCRAAIEPADVDNAIQAARCRSCRRLVDLSAQLGTSGAVAIGGSAPSVIAPAFGGLRGHGDAVQPGMPVVTPRGPVPMPPKFKIEQGADFTLSWRWFGPQFLFLVFFCLFWDGFLVVWYTIAVGSMIAGGAGAGVIPMILFPLIHVGVGVGLTYFTMCGFVNSTVIRIAGGRLSVKHGPLPWRGNCEIDAGSLDQLYSEQRVHRGKNGTTYSYDVMAIERDGMQRKLVSGLTEASHALFLEQTLESQLGIADRAVGGELPR